MEKDPNSKPDCGLPPSGRFSGSNMKPEPSEQGIPSSTVPELSVYSNDLSRMPDTPSKNVRHRRAHSEILTLPDDITFDSDLGVVGIADGPALSDETDEDLFPMYLDMEKVNSSSATSQFQIGEPSSAAQALHPQSENVNQRPRIRHQHSYSMDGSTTIKQEMLVSGGEENPAAKKATSAAKLAELALIDPKRAKRILANRQSAARSKERKMRYIAELEYKVQTLQTEATTISAQCSLLRRDTNGLNAENNDLKLRLQTIEQQVHLQDVLNEALKEEMQHLKRLTGQAMPNGGSMTNFSSASSFGAGASQPFYPNNQKMHSLLTAQQQFQQMQIHSQKQQLQFQPHQQQQLLNQLKQQQQQQMQHEQSQNQRVGDMKFGGLMQRENASD